MINIFSSSIWSFHNPVEIIYGDDCFTGLPSLAKGNKIIILSSSGATRRGTTVKITNCLKDREVTLEDRIDSPPTISSVEHIFIKYRHYNPDCIIALGGGSVIDTAKTLRFMITRFSRQNNIPHLKGILDGKPQDIPICDQQVILIAISTISGSGSEVTPFATIWDEKNKFKYSIETEDMYPTTAILEPSLTLTVPFNITIASAVDSLSHFFDSLLNKAATPVTNLFSITGIRLLLEALPCVQADPCNIALKEKLIYAGLLSGLCISKTRTSLSHAISYTFTSNFNIPHGIASAFTLPALIKYHSTRNRKYLLSISSMIGYESPEELSASLNRLLSRLGIYKTLSKSVCDANEIYPFIPQMLASNRLRNSMNMVSSDDLKSIITDSMSSQ